MAGVLLASLDASTVPAGQMAHLCVGSQAQTPQSVLVSAFRDILARCQWETVACIDLTKLWK